MKKFNKGLLIFTAAVAIAAMVGFSFRRNEVAPVGDDQLSDGSVFEISGRDGENVAKAGQSSSSIEGKKQIPASIKNSEESLAYSKAISMFRESEKCVSSYRAMQALEFELKRCEMDASWHDSASCIESQRRAAGGLPQLRREAEHCEGMGTKAFDDLRFEIVANAARLGDIDAQVCFVQSDFDLRDSEKSSPSSVEQYKSDATRYVDAAMARGDWRIPLLFTVSDHALSHNHGLFPVLMPRDELTRYRMMRLLRYGAVGSYASTLDTALAEYTEARANGLRGYPPEQLAAADEWARQQYEKSFANSPQLEARPKICAD